MRGCAFGLMIGGAIMAGIGSATGFWRFAATYACLYGLGFSLLLLDKELPHSDVPKYVQTEVGAEVGAGVRPGE